jgi:hypothetical protein
MPKGDQPGVFFWIFPRVFFISHIIFDILEINIYSIIDSKVFGVTICVNFLLAIVKQRFNNCKHMVVVERMQLSSMNGENAN